VIHNAHFHNLLSIVIIFLLVMLVCFLLIYFFVVGRSTKYDPTNKNDFFFKFMKAHVQVRIVYNDNS